jgi:hypothetical protein
MAIDSSLIAAVLLLGTALFTAVGGGGNYLRFAAMLLAALAAACLSRQPGLAAAAGLIALPLSGAALGLCALARAGARLPQLPATLLLAGALACGLGALFTGTVMAALLPLALGGIAMIAASLKGGVAIAAMAGFLVLGAACAGLSDGLGAASLSLLAAGLFGANLQKRVSSRRADFSAGMPYEVRTKRLRS